MEKYMRNKSIFTKTSTNGTALSANVRRQATAAPVRHHLVADTPHVGLLPKGANRKDLSTPVISEEHEVIKVQGSIVDKLILVLPIAAVSPSTLESIADRFSSIRGLRGITPKGDNYQKRYVLPCPGGSKIIFGVLPANPRMRFALKIVMNPAHITAEDTALFIRILAQAFVPEPKAMLSKFLIQRVDQAYDHPVAISDLIVHAIGSTVEEKYYVASDRSGRIQTWYCGSVQSKERFISYDQVDSDAFKVAHGEKPSRPSPYADAEVVIDKPRGKADMTRFEARRMFQDPLTLEAIDLRPQPFGRFAIYLVDTARVHDAPAMFSLYLESVRLRGVTGARMQFLANHPGKPAKQQLSEFESFLGRCVAPWWDQAKLDCSVKNGLRRTPAWRALKFLASEQCDALRPSF
jgi:hypothetical protein